MIRIFSYSRESNRMESPEIGELPRHLADRGRTIWVDLEDPNDEETGVLGGIFGFHILAVEDCIDDAYLPKLDQYDGYTYMIFHAADPKGQDHFQSQKVDVFVGPNFLVTHHRSEVKGIFDTRGEVAKNPGSLLRSPDWLLHGILNAMIDNYLPAVAGLESRIEGSETSLSTGDVSVADVIQARRELLLLERLAKGQLDILMTLASESDFVHDDNRFYFRDVADHLRHIHHRAEYHATLASSAVAGRDRDRGPGLSSRGQGICCPHCGPPSASRSDDVLLNEFFYPARWRSGAEAGRRGPCCGGLCRWDDPVVPPEAVVMNGVQPWSA